MKAKKILRNPLLWALLLLVGAWWWSIPGRVEIVSPQLEVQGRMESVQLPLVTRTVGNGQEFQVAFSLMLNPGSPTRYQIVPDDCLLGLKVNGQDVPLQGLQGLCDYGKGVALDLAPYLGEGENRVMLKMRNNGGDAGLRFENSRDGLSSVSVAGYAVGILLAVLAYMLSRRAGLGFGLGAVVVLGVVVRLLFFSYTGPMQTAHDVGGHLEYVKLMQDNPGLPEEKQCWSCYHPPLYYAASAVAKDLADAHDPSWSPRFLQQIQLVLSCLVMGLGVLLLQRMLGGGGAALLASLLWVLWPGAVITAPRLGNDVPFYLGQMLCLYFAQLWWEEGKGRHMLLATLGAALAIASKSTGAVTVAVWALVYGLGVLRNLRLDRWPVLLGALGLMLAGVGLAQSRTVEGMMEGREAALVGNAQSLSSGLAVGNGVGNYLYLDVREYLLRPYLNPWQDEGGRQYFWNYLLKSSLFGEFRLWDTPVGQVLAGMLSLLSLGVFALLLWGIVQTSARGLPLLLALVASLAAMVALRAQYPFSCSNDFRYIMPMLVPMAYLALQGAGSLQNVRLKIVAYGWLTFFSLASLLFMLLPAAMA